jgi:hypothetical protein
MIHRLGDAGYQLESVHPKMGALAHQTDDPREASQVTCFGREEWVCNEKRDDAVRKIRQPTDAEAPHVLPVTSFPMTYRHRATSEERPQPMKDRDTPRSLNDRELRLALPTQATRSVPEDRDAEASLAVDEADDPLRS